MQPLFLGGHPALDFLNTTLIHDGGPYELIPDGAALLDWLVAAGQLTASAAASLRRRLGADALDTAAAEARRLRGWATEWLERRLAEPDAPAEAEIKRLNELMRRAASYRQLARRDGRLVIEPHRRDASADELVAQLAEQLAELFATEDPALIKRCEGSACTLWFADRTRSHRRRFCSVTSCGNRAKVAAFRARQQ